MPCMSTSYASRRVLELIAPVIRAGAIAVRSSTAGLQAFTLSTSRLHAPRS